MVSLQEVKEALYSAIDYFNHVGQDWLHHEVSDDEIQERHNQTVEWSKRAVMFLENQANSHLQTLAYILLEHFDGEYIMSGYDVDKAFENKVFFIEYEQNDDNSLRITAWSEDTE